MILLYGFIYKRDCGGTIFNIYLLLSYINAPKYKEYIFQDILLHRKERVHHYVPSAGLQVVIQWIRYRQVLVRMGPHLVGPSSGTYKVIIYLAPDLIGSCQFVRPDPALPVFAT